ncbi:hypothetical protein ACJX0J_035437, partial [Zea mays]
RNLFSYILSLFFFTCCGLYKRRNLSEREEKGHQQELVIIPESHALAPSMSTQAMGATTFMLLDDVFSWEINHEDIIWRHTKDNGIQASVCFAFRATSMEALHFHHRANLLVVADKMMSFSLPTQDRDPAHFLWGFSKRYIYNLLLFIILQRYIFLKPVRNLQRKSFILRERL